MQSLSKALTVEYLNLIVEKSNLVIERNKGKEILRDIDSGKHDSLFP